MPRLVILEPPSSPAWLPFSASRPISEVRAGAWLIRERWEAIADSEADIIFAEAHLHAFTEEGVPPVQAPGDVEGPAIVGLSSFAPTGVVPSLGDEPAALVNDDSVVGWWVPVGVTWHPGDEPAPRVEIDGIQLHGAYDLVTALEHFLVADVADFTSEGGDELPHGSIVIGDPHDVVILGANVEPGVTFDVRRGAVVIEQHVYVKGGTRFEGPVYVGPGSEILGGQISWTAIGQRCKVRGEVTHTVFVGYGNKAHDGFVGHSVLGRWVNLGADTVTSNLKNTYGVVRLDVAGSRIDTERQMLGSLIGDHAKTAIGTLLSTGTVVCVGANVFDAARPPKYVPPFAWGTGGAVMKKEGFLEVVERVMPRRQVPVTDELRTALTAMYDHSVQA